MPRWHDLRDSRGSCSLHCGSSLLSFLPVTQKSLTDRCLSGILDSRELKKYIRNNNIEVTTDHQCRVTL